MVCLYLGNESETEYINLQQAIGDCCSDIELICSSSGVRSIYIGQKIDFAVVKLVAALADIPAFFRQKQDLMTYDMSIKFIGICEQKEDAFEGFSLEFDDVYMKTLSGEGLKNFILRFIGKKINHKITVTTMPSLNVNAYGVNVTFESKKAREIFAYLINAEGKQVSNYQLISDIWEGLAIDESARNRCRVSFSYLRSTLRKYGISDILGSKGSFHWINREKIDCDLYELLRSSRKADMPMLEDIYYLEEYSWAERTKGRIARLR